MLLRILSLIFSLAPLFSAAASLNDKTVLPAWLPPWSSPLLSFIVDFTYIYHYSDASRIFSWPRLVMVNHWQEQWLSFNPSSNTPTVGSICTQVFCRPPRTQIQCDPFVHYSLRISGHISLCLKLSHPLSLSAINYTFLVLLRLCRCQGIESSSVANRLDLSFFEKFSTSRILAVPLLPCEYTQLYSPYVPIFSLYRCLSPFLLTPTRVRVILSAPDYVHVLSISWRVSYASRSHQSNSFWLVSNLI